MAHNMMLAWGQSADRERLLPRIQEIFALDAAVRPCPEVAEQNLRLFGKDVASDHAPSPHTIYFRGDDQVRIVAQIFDEIRAGKTIPCRVEGLLGLHGRLFSPCEDAGMLSAVDNGLRRGVGQNGWEYSYYATPAKDKRSELEWLFAMYDQAKREDPDFALAYAACFKEYLAKIHPFVDGNGRTLRVMFISELRSAGLAYAADIPFEASYGKYRNLVTLRISQADEGRYTRDLAYGPYARVLLDLVKRSYLQLKK